MELEATLEEVRYFLKKYAAGSSKSLLDIGCGDGTTITDNLKSLEYSGIKYTGLDSYYWDDPERNIVLEPAPNRKFVYGVAEKIPFNDNSFDLVTATHVFEHIKDLEPVCREVNRVLKPDGKAFIFVPLEGGDFVGWLNDHKNVHRDIRVLLDRLKLIPYHFVSPHVQFKNYEGWKEYLGRYFTVVESHGRGSYTMLFLTFLNNALGSLSRNKFSLSHFIKRRHPNLFVRAIRRNNKIQLDAGYILAPKKG